MSLDASADTIIHRVKDLVSRVDNCDHLLYDLHRHRFDDQFPNIIALIEEKKQCLINELRDINQLYKA